MSLFKERLIKLDSHRDNRTLNLQRAGGTSSGSTWKDVFTLDNIGLLSFELKDYPGMDVKKTERGSDLIVFSSVTVEAAK